jgi:DNA-binding MarR family transcriptional regulator
MGISEDIKQKEFKSEFNKVLINLMYSNNWLNQKQNKLFKPRGITSAQYNVLRILRGQYPKTATVNLIIERMLDRMSNASRIVEKLVSKKLVSRIQCPSDRRAVDIKINDSGLELLDKLDLEIEQMEISLNSFSDEELKLMNGFLDRFREEN